MKTTLEPQVITDTHFGHKKMIVDCGRPEGFEELIFEGLRGVQGGNPLIHLGDVCIGRDDYWHQRIMESYAGPKWLVLGNHDRKSWSWYMKMGWDFVGDRIGLEMYGRHILLSHRPILQLNPGVINVHGHLHNTGRYPEGYDFACHRLVVCEHSYKPVGLRSLVEQPKR